MLLGMTPPALQGLPTALVILAAAGLAAPGSGSHSELAERSGPRASIREEYVLPPGPVADRVATLARLERSAPEAPAWPRWTPPSGPDDPWAAEAPWRDWVELVRDEAAAEPPDPGRRARLALLARAQGRDADAWRHLLAAGETAEASALLPAFLPGLLTPDPEADGGGSHLAPALPPGSPTADGPLRSLVGREMRLEGFALGGARLSITVRVEGDGVQVDLAHLEGPEVRVAVTLPVPPGVELGVVYADWERLDETDAPVPLVLSPDSPTHELWGRFRSLAVRWPAPLPGDDSPLVRTPERVVIQVPRGGAPDPRVARFAEGLAELIERPTSLRRAGDMPRESEEGRGLEPLLLHLDDPAEAERKLVALMGLAEAHALAGVAAR